jgi:hypothetical protein
MEVSKLIAGMTLGKYKSLIPFQKGILLPNRSLSELYDYVSVKYKTEYILTLWLNQNILEKIFSHVGGMGANNEHPAPLDLKYT